MTWCVWSRPAPGRAAVWQLAAAGLQLREARSRGCSGSTLFKIQPLSASTVHLSGISRDIDTDLGSVVSEEGE